MGCGSWTPRDWDTYSKSSIAGKSAAGIYTSRSVKPEFDPKGIPMRESRDSDDHPNSNAIIIGLDVTGSMSDILEGVAKKLNVLVTEILDRKPVTDPQIMFNAIGDAMCDSTPFQATQFESDIRIAEQLTQLYFERGGGGNMFESYPLAWYFAAMHTDIDCLNKRNQKGFLFTMGDDCYAPYRCCYVVQHLLVLPGILLTQCFRPCFSRRFESKPEKDKSMARPAYSYVANSRHCYCYAVLKR